MPQLTPAQTSWIQEICQRLSVSTGWSIVFRAPEEWQPGTSLHDGTSLFHSLSLWLDSPSQESPQLAGVMCVEGTPQNAPQTDWPVVRQLLQLQAESISRVLSLEQDVHSLQENIQDGFRLRRELRVASLAASSRPAPPSFQSLQISTRQKTREEIGGDLCQVFPIDADRIAILVGDATGDGIPAAMIRSTAEGAMRYALLQTEIDPEETDLLVKNMNRSLCAILAEDQFISLFLSIWNQRTRELHYTNAGHPAPLLVRNESVRELSSHGMLLGILPSSDYASAKLTLEPDDQLILFSDGISEAIAQSPYGSLRQLVESSLQTQPGRTQESLANLLWETAIISDQHEDDRSLLIAGVPSVRIEPETPQRDLITPDRSQRADPPHPSRFHVGPHGTVAPPHGNDVSCDQNRDTVFPLD